MNACCLGFLGKFFATLGARGVAKIVSFRQRVVEIRQIAMGIFDKQERNVVLDFVSDVEVLVGKTRLAGQLGERSRPLKHTQSTA